MPRSGIGFKLSNIGNNRIKKPVHTTGNNKKAKKNDLRPIRIIILNV
jgi:hypothetical protein